MPDKGTKDSDLSHEAWIEVDGRLCYVQRTVLFKPDSISFPEKYRNKIPCLVTIEQRYQKGEHKGEKMFPDLYELREHMILDKKLRLIQKRKCDGWVVPISELVKYVG
jgi:hypothetical protein